jgi:hypothetical protein
MTSVEMKQELPADAATVWQLIGGFNALPEWHPAAATSELDRRDGATYRTITVTGGIKLVERLEAHDDAGMYYSYSNADGPLPVADYHSTLRVEAGASGSTVHWSGHFQPKGASEAEAVKVIEGIYRAGLDALRKRFG